MLSPIEEVIMDWISAGFLVAVGVVGGVWNAVAGGATLFTFPALMAAGLPPVVANATNYLALLPSNAAALPAYRDELRRMGPALWPLVCVSGAGAAAGSLLLMVSTPSVFLNLVPVLILVATALFAFGEAVRAALLRALGHGRGDRAIRLLLFVASVYGGYFGAVRSGVVGCVRLPAIRWSALRGVNTPRICGVRQALGGSVCRFVLDQVVGKFRCERIVRLTAAVECDGAGGQIGQSAAVVDRRTLRRHLAGELGANA